MNYDIDSMPTDVILTDKFDLFPFYLSFSFRLLHTLSLFSFSFSNKLFEAFSFFLSFPCLSLSLFAYPIFEKILKTIELRRLAISICWEAFNDSYSISLSLELSIRTTLDLVQLSSIEWLSFKKVVSLSLLSLRIFLTSAPLVHECRWLCIIAFIPNDMNKPEVGFYIEKCSSAASEWNMFTIAGIIISCC